MAETGFEALKRTCDRNNQRTIESATSRTKETTLYLIASQQSHLAKLSTLFPDRSTTLADDFDTKQCQLYDLSKLLPALSKLTFGQALIYADILSSTQTLAQQTFASLANDLSFVTLGAVQTQGIGRTGNRWESILGGITVTITTQIPFERMRELHTLQYVTALAVVDAVQSLSTETLPIYIKWPNDVIVNKESPQKISGILFQSSLCGRTCIINGGVGINVNNSEKMVVETTCVSNVLGKKVSREDVLVAFLKSLDEKLKQWKASGFAPFQQAYEAVWMHTNQEVQVQDETQPFIISGLDAASWFLRGVGKDDSSKVLTLHPDGNRFDALHGLISPKKS